jgi:thiol-disulfide isomerase/thioredoxin
MSITSVRRALAESRWTFPGAAVLVLAAIFGIGRCPRAHPAAQDFSLPVVSPEGRSGPDRMRLADQRGKVVLLDFWATWCGPCQASTPVLVRLNRRFGARGLVVMGINVDQEGPQVIPFFVRRFGVDYPVLYDDGAVSERYHVTGLPTAVLIDRQGRIQRVHVGQADERELADQIESLL